MLRTKLFLFFLIAAGGFACTSPTFYTKTYEFNKSVASGHIEEAEKMLEDNKDKLEESKIRFLYFVNAGLVEHLKGDFEKSNSFFEKADLFVEDERKKAMEEGAALLLNPNISTYRGEDHEILMINYYKALNYYLLNQPNEALVEVRRLNLRLQDLSDQYENENKYQRDAYMHLLMGLIYDATDNFNDAFIAYRNAYNIYESDFANLFGLRAPDQLKKDLVRTATLSGMKQERREYEEKFDYVYVPGEYDATGVLLWHNGMGPIKDEWGINFAIVYTGGGWIAFVNEQYGMSFPFYVGNTDLAGLTWIKVVFPKYTERGMLYSEAKLSEDGEEFRLELAQDINAISFKVLEERMGLEFSKSLLRVALKQVAAHEIGKSADSPALGAALSVAASASESADTRNWNTLPHSIYYVRVPLKAGKHSMLFELDGPQAQHEEHLLEFTVDEGDHVIYPFYSLAAKDPHPTTR